MKRLASFLAGWILVLAPTRGFGALYTVTDLGTLGGSNSIAYGINERGQVVGAADTGDGGRIAFLWENGTIRSLGTLQDGNSVAYSINTNGVAVGSSTSKDGSSRAVIFQNGKVVDLAPELSDPCSARAINDAGEIVGTLFHSDSTSSYQAAYRFSPSVKRLGQVGFGSSLNSINNEGIAAGSSSFQDFWFDYPRTRAANWDVRRDDAYTRVTPTPSEAFGINDRGTSVGKSFYDYFGWAPTLWNGSMEARLSGLGGREAVAHAVNGWGEIVGSVKLSDLVSLFEPGRSYGAALWIGGHAYYLDDLISPDSGWELTEAYGINNKGQIVGAGIRNKMQRAFLLDPVPSVGKAPEIKIVSPAPGASFNEMQSLEIKVEAVDDGAIEKVDFYFWELPPISPFVRVLATAPKEPIFSRTSAPWTVQIPNLVPGRFAIMARATDNNGNVTYTREEAVVLNLRPVLRAQGRNVDGTFHFQVFSGPSSPVTIQTSTNLLNWENMPQRITIPEADPRNHIDSDGSRFSRRFYRAIPQSPGQ